MSTSPSEPMEVVKKLLANTLNPDVVRELVASDATYISLNYDDPDLQRILPYAGTHAKGERHGNCLNPYLPSATAVAYTHFCLLLMG